jgi:K+-sensing histidine kinase KdpD
VVAAGIAVASALHYFTSPSLILWHNLFQRLYYLPIIYAAIYFGWRGGLVASAASAVCYIPHILHAWHHMLDYAMNQCAEIIVFFLVGTVTGVLADRGMRQRRELAALNRELQDSFEQIKRADRLSAVGQLSASLAHEIRNPLASIDGAPNLIESDQTPQEIRKASLAIIRKEVQRLNRLLTNLLDFARPRKPEFQTVHADRLIDGIIALAGHSAEQKGITLHKDVSATVPQFECDPEQIKQVILNLVISALQARNKLGALLRGLLFCVPCGTPMTHTYTMRKSKRYRYYVCYNAQQKGWQNCETKAVSAQAIETAVLDSIRRIGTDPKLAEAVAAEALDQMARRRRDLDQEFDTLRCHARYPLLIRVTAFSAFARSRLERSARIRGMRCSPCGPRNPTRFA